VFRAEGGSNWSDVLAENEIEEPVQAVGILTSIEMVRVNCGLYSIIDYSDEYSERYRKMLLDSGFRVLSVKKGAFYYLPVSTLQTYLSPNIYLIYRKCETLVPVTMDAVSTVTSFGTMQKSIREGQEIDLISSVSITGVHDWNGSDFYRTKRSGYTVLGSYIESDRDTGSIKLKIRRGASVYYRSGPVNDNQTLILYVDPPLQLRLPVSTDWSLLSFNSDRLPDHFMVEFIDDGNSWGEWSAIGLQAESSVPDAQEQ
jgi:hypothetical protein